MAFGAAEALHGPANLLDREQLANLNARDAEAAARYQAMWILFGSTLLAAVAAGVGGWLGGGHIDPVYDRR